MTHMSVRNSNVLASLVGYLTTLSVVLCGVGDGMIMNMQQVVD
jgi:hypothetical protein